MKRMFLRGKGPPLLRDNDSGCVLRTLEKIESESGLFEFSNIKNPVFLESTNVMIITTPLQRIINFKMWAKILLGHMSIHHALIPLDYSKTRAETIRVKNNVIAFYNSKNIVCKFFLDNGFRSKNALSNEVRAIKSSEGLDFIKTPKIIIDLTEPNFETPVIWLEMIEGITPKLQNNSDFVLKMLDSLFPWYEHHGITFDSPSSLTENLFESDEIPIELASFGWNEDEAKSIHDSIYKIRNCKEFMPLSYIHGDASLGNTIIDKEDNIIIIDWEMSRNDFIAIDLLKLIQQGGEPVQQKSILWFNGVAPSCYKIIPLDIQIQIIDLCQNIDLNNKEIYFKKMQNLDMVEESILFIKQRVLNCSKQINAYLSPKTTNHELQHN